MELNFLKFTMIIRDLFVFLELLLKNKLLFYE